MSARLLAFGAALLLASAAAAEEAAPPAENRFPVLEYRIEGNRLLSTLAIEAAVSPHMGEARSIADVESARMALEQAYHDAGYLTVFVSIPEQKVDQGIVRLKVVEGTVDRLRITGSRYFSLSRIKERVPALAEGSVPYFPDVQKQLAALSRSADRRITPVLKPGRTPGTVDVELKVEDDRPLHGLAEINNRYSVDTSHSRISGSIRWDNLWQREHSLGIAYQVAPENSDDGEAVSATYSVPIESGDFLAVYGVHSTSDVATLGTLGVIGNGDIAGLRYILPLTGRKDFFHSLSLGVDYKSFDQTVRLQGADSFTTPISYLPFVVAWDGTWVRKGSQTHTNIAANFHVRDLVGEEQEFADKRFKASSSYFYLRGLGEQTWSRESGMGVKLRAGFQFADSPLVSNEQFVLGGVDTVRGYLESEALGDYGAVGGLEWQSAHAKWPPIQKIFGIVFIEGGRVRIRDPLPSQIEAVSLWSAGAGLRIEAWKRFVTGVDLAWPMRDGSRTLKGEERVLFNIGFEF